ncbi:unnamed protein product [Rhizophagus irregularis]|uniref:K Homology domain-containing protein n=1 Tax=Rhizophagus irregularis TaxID=588596 RepID=A0A915ZQU0_9GLOM|nr:unnamed protein product [Rhizophagus irregularis]CAB5383724.1 unnamed protein product [Rhizophagus irregularis]
MQNSISHSIISTTMEIPKHVVIGKLIGRRGRKIKPIEKGTGTHILITTEENLRQIEIRINRDVKDKNENISPGERINEAICQVDKLIEDIEMRNRRKDIEKEGKNGRISDNRNQQHATPRNHKNNDPKEKRKRPKRRVPHTTQENVRTVNRTNYNQSN